MSVAAGAVRPVPESMPDDVESPTGKLVYLYLATAGEAAVEEMAAHLDMKRISLFSVLQTLAGRGVVEDTGGRYRLARDGPRRARR